MVDAEDFIAGSLKSMRHASDNQFSNVWEGLLTLLILYPGHFGLVGLDRNGIVSKFIEKSNTATDCIDSAATYLLDNHVFSLVLSLPNLSHETSQHLLPKLVNQLVPRLLPEQ